MNLRVMSFNIRYPEPSDGAHIWENRRDFVATLILTENPDVVGLQEPVMEQMHFLDSALPGYARFGVGRYANDEEKFTAIYYRHDSMELLESSAFWLSETPDVPASSSWEIHKPYAVNWARMRHASGWEFAIFNTHFPYKPSQAEARLRSAALLRDRAAAEGESVILTGDFNSKAGREVHRILLEQFRDAREEAEVCEGPEGTVHGFTGDAFDRRVDWILFRGPLAVTSFRTLNVQRSGLYPSDHFPIVAELRLDTSPQTPQPSTPENPAVPV
jgi:endonuclease/exonuclease/phosphatase family metal-dependent hydrolase